MPKYYELILSAVDAQVLALMLGERHDARKALDVGIAWKVVPDDRLLEEARPALLILCHGGNDLLRKLDEKQAADNLRAMVRMVTPRPLMSPGSLGIRTPP